METCKGPFSANYDNIEKHIRTLYINVNKQEQTCICLKGDLGTDTVTES